jgi:hypothetical protein
MTVKMRKLTWLLGPVASGLLFLFSAFSGNNADYPGGSPAGYTGSPGDGKNCTYCHGGSASQVTDWITSNIPPEGYTPFQTYTITVTVSGSGIKGFQVSPQNLNGDLLGTLIAGPNTHLNGNGKYINQNNGNNSNPAIWTFDWTAPKTGTGDVTFYGAFTVSKPVTKLSTLLVHEQIFPLTVDASATPEVIVVGDSSHLLATPSGGTGDYTFTWISIPEGFHSTIADPWISPIDTTLYIVTVTDGIGTASDSVTVFVTTGTGFNDPDQGYVFTVHFDPGSSSIKLRLAKADEYKLMVYDSKGTLMLHQSFNDSYLYLDASSFQPGLYILRVDQEGKKTVKKVLVF